MVWLAPIVATLLLMVASVAVAMIIGFVSAWAVYVLRSGGASFRAVSMLLMVAMILAAVTPLILHAAAWEATAGKFGIGILTQTGARALPGDRYGFFAGFWATAWIHGLHGAAMVGIATAVGTARIPKEIADQAMLDASVMGRWFRVHLPVAAPWWVTALVATAGLVVTEMTVADLYGYRTIADQFYLYYAVEPTLASIFVTCSLPLVIVVALVGWGVRRRRLDHSVDEFASPGIRDGWAASEKISGGLRGLAVLAAVSAGLLMVGVPIYGLIQNLGRSVETSDAGLVASWSAEEATVRLMAAPSNFRSEYQWTLVLMFAAACVSLVLALPLASWERRYPVLRFPFGVAAIMLVCLPGPIVGLMVVRCFQLQVPGFRLLYQQTIIPTVMALSMRTVPIAYWILKAGYRGISDSTLGLARLEASPWRIFWRIEFPLLRRWIWGALVSAAIFASGDLPVTLPVAPPGVSTVPTRLFGLLHSGARYQEAALSLWYLIGLAIAVGLMLGPSVFFKPSRDR